MGKLGDVRCVGVGQFVIMSASLPANTCHSPNEPENLLFVMFLPSCGLPQIGWPGLFSNQRIGRRLLRTQRMLDSCQFSKICVKIPYLYEVPHLFCLIFRHNSKISFVTKSLKGRKVDALFVVSMSQDSPFSQDCLALTAYVLSNVKKSVSRKYIPNINNIFLFIKQVLQPKCSVTFCLALA